MISKNIKKAFVIATGIIAFLPDDAFTLFKPIPKAANIINVLSLKVILLLLVCVGIVAIDFMIRKKRKRVIIKTRNFRIVVEYGDLFTKQGKRIINFDECYTAEIGTKKWQIKKGSLCGKYLLNHADLDIKKLISESNIVPCKEMSKFNNQKRYESGTIIPYGDDFLMAFAKLDAEGLGVLTLNEYQNCLSKMWAEINAYYDGTNVNIPLLGSGITRIGDNNLTNKELLNIIIDSYKLTLHKIKLPHELHIVCLKEDVSLFEIDSE